ncbi:hypothetical protein PLICRDRAFT_92587 [Plicaturopsis crispa FD-325 SS-3]|nr:hypothetical protein PLICRDRAFT_92587 [Plicaturopsis crispa FD-325 SS-3]
MTYAPTNPVDVPPYQLQPLIASVKEGPFYEPSGRPSSRASTPTAVPRVVCCAQALGSEIYIGCSNGELLRFALQADDPNTIETYSLLSRQSLPVEKPIDEIVLAPSISRALILCDHQIHFYTLPSLDPVHSIKPIRNVITFAVNDQHLRRSAPSLTGPPQKIEPIEFCVIKRGNIALYSLADRLFYQKEVPLPQVVSLARRTGRYLCVADAEFYNVVDLEAASLVPLLPLSQAPDTKVKPSITVVSENEFLILSWTGASTLGVFITGDGDPVRGTLEWPSHPLAVCLDYPYITTLLPNNTIEIHSIETQAIAQVISAPSLPSRLALSASPNGYFVPSQQRSEKMRLTPVRLLRTKDEVLDPVLAAAKKFEGLTLKEDGIRV